MGVFASRQNDLQIGLPAMPPSGLLRARATLKMGQMVAIYITISLIVYVHIWYLRVVFS